MGPGGGRDPVQAGSAQLTAVAAQASGPLEVTEDGPRLVAGRCGECGHVVFPLRERCPACAGAVERMLLPRRGTLWTWTTQGFEPSSPPYVRDAGEFEPFGVGYVEFPELLRVEGRLTEADPGRVRIGMTMEVVVRERPSGTTYAFAPVEDD